MQKIPTMFERDTNKPFRVIDKVTEGCEWVTAGEGVATRKFDGTCYRVLNKKLYRRHVLKEGRAMPPGWVHWTDDPEQKSGHGWLPVTDHPSDQWHTEAWAGQADILPDGTYELCGPKVQKNAELDYIGPGNHVLIRHGTGHYLGCPRDFDSLKAWFKDAAFEGVVWHHPDGRMVKIKLKDFGLHRLG